MPAFKSVGATVGVNFIAITAKVARKLPWNPLTALYTVAHFIFDFTLQRLSMSKRFAICQWHKFAYHSSPSSPTTFKLN